MILQEFHGASAFGNTIDVWLSGFTAVGGYVLFGRGAIRPVRRGEHVSRPAQRAAHLRGQLLLQQRLADGLSGEAKSCGAIEIGPDAKTKATQQTPIIAQFNQGLFASAQQYDVAFDTNTTTGKPCNCRVAMGSGMIDEVTQGTASPGQPTTNLASLLTGQTTYAPPVFANAASIGRPLTLNPNELGVGGEYRYRKAAPGKGGFFETPRRMRNKERNGKDCCACRDLQSTFDAA